jgi:hypothetical protein
MPSDTPTLDEIVRDCYGFCGWYTFDKIALEVAGLKAKLEKAESELANLKATIEQREEDSPNDFGPEEGAW